MTYSSQRQTGMTLIEVLIALLLFSLGVLGMVALQGRATQISTDAEDRNRAAMLANEAVSLLWQYVPTQGATPSAIPPAVIAAWQAEVAAPANAAGSSSGLLGLPGGVGAIVQDPVNPNEWDITIKWFPPSHSGYATSEPSRYVTKVIINAP